MPSTFIENVEWGGPRPCCVYLSAGLQDTGRDWPVLYLLHGIGDNETTWQGAGHVQAILDRLGPEGEARIQPLAVVMPFGFLQELPRTQRFLPDVPAFNKYFRNGLARVEGTLGIVTTRNRRAIAGLSMGGLQALEVALNNLDLFSVIGTFSAALNMRDVEQTCPILNDPNQINNSLRFFYGAAGDDSGSGRELPFRRLSEKFYNSLGARGMRVVFQPLQGDHNWNLWLQCLEDFIPRPGLPWT